MRCSSQLTLAAVLLFGSAVLVADTRAGTRTSETPDKAVGPGLQADLDRSQRGWGTALEAAQRMGHDELAAALRKGGARTFGKSVADTVCVRPWDGYGYCGWWRRSARPTTRSA
jgi:hypothetical protein